VPIYDVATRTVIADTAPVSGAVNTNVQIDLFSDAKVQWINDDALNRIEFPWTVIGGNSLPDGGVVPRFFFLKPPWVLRPYEADHAWNLSGNIFRLDGAKLTTSTLGDFTVEVNVITDVGPQDPFGALAIGDKTFADLLVELWRMRGLDKDNPVTVTQDQETAGGITLDITGDNVNTNTLTRQP